MLCTLLQTPIQSCVKSFLLSSENHPQDVLPSSPKLHDGAAFQPTIPGTWQECFCTTLYKRIEKVFVSLAPDFPFHWTYKYEMQFIFRYANTVTSLLTPSCFLVAVHNTAATTALSDVNECYANQRKRRKRSIVEDKPFASTLSKDIIMPSRWTLPWSAPGCCTGNVGKLSNSWFDGLTWLCFAAA